MSDKCDKFESYFTFMNEQDFLAHVQSCPDCAQEYEKMQKVSDLISQVKPYYKKSENSRLRLKAACMLLLIGLFSTAIGVATLNPDISDTIKYGSALTAEDYGFPVDSYGLISVE